MIALITAILAAAKPLLDDIYFNNVMALLREYEDVLKKVSEELTHWPDLDDQKLGFLKKERLRLEEALKLQAAIVQVKSGG